MKRRAQASSHHIWVTSRKEVRRPHLRLQEVGGEAVDADALGDGVARVPQARALGLLMRERDAARDRIEQAGARRVDQHDLRRTTQSV